VLEHWDGDRRNSPAVFRELQRHGYQGSYPTLVRYLRRLRMAQAIDVPADGLRRGHARCWPWYLTRR